MGVLKRYRGERVIMWRHFLVYNFIISWWWSSSFQQSHCHKIIDNSLTLDSRIKIARSMCEQNKVTVTFVNSRPKEHKQWMFVSWHCRRCDYSILSLWHFTYCDVRTTITTNSYFYTLVTVYLHFAVFNHV